MMRTAVVGAGIWLVGCGGGSSGSTLDAGADGAVLPEADAAVELQCRADEPFSWPMETSPVPISPSVHWNNRLQGLDDPFAATAPGSFDVRWVKFAILLRDPSVVYFQDSGEYPFHYDFASELLDPYVGMEREEFDRISLHEANQEVALGAVVWPAAASRGELAVQLVRHDAYHPEMARQLIDLVAASIDAPAGTTTWYFPTFEQAESTAACQQWYADHGVAVGSLDRWVSGDSCYANGWALGRLVYVPGSEISQAYASGALQPSDVLLTDSVPSEVPFVAGIVTSVPTTTSSHVALLARAYGVPFAHLADDAAVQRAHALVGRDTVLRAYSSMDGCTVDLLDVQGQIAPDDRAALLALKDPPPLELVSVARLGAYFVSADQLTESDVRHVGGKAANFGLLRATIPDQAPEAIALSFDVWLDFMGQEIEPGLTLQAAIASRLGGFGYPPDVAAVERALQEVRELITIQAAFSPELQQQVLTALAGFDPTTRLRFRSSTNVEDTAVFIGAGLYDSYSGCVADDTDDDVAGPSRCDPTRAGERGAIRAIRKVFASFYNTNAFLERLRHSVDEQQVGMAILVHRSFPDQLELANGVAVGGHSTYSTSFMLSSQPGAVSVTNPTGEATPELVEIYTNGLGIYPTVLTASSLLPLGATVLAMPEEYEQLGTALQAVDDAYAARHPGLESFTLDYEYKKIAEQGLIVKQVRRLPTMDRSSRWPTYLVDEPRRFCVQQSEGNNVFASHRLKSVWDISTEARWLDSDHLQTGMYRQVEVEFLQGLERTTLAGDPSSWPGASHSYVDERVKDGFTLGSGAQQLRITIDVLVPSMTSVQYSPVRTLGDHHSQLIVDYATPRPNLHRGEVSLRETDWLELGPCPVDAKVGPGNSLIEDSLSVGGVTVETAYWWPEPPTGPIAGYTAWLHKWRDTVITGLTSEPIVLTDYYSQTQQPGHHNFTMDYIFDPWLEPGLDPALLAELEAANVRFLYIEQSSDMWVFGLDGTFRQLQ